MTRAIGALFTGLLYIVLLVHLLFWAVMTWRLIRVVENHISLEVSTFNLVSYSLIGLAGVVALTRRARYLPLVSVILALLSLGGVFYLDRYNLVLSYETWIVRGMPEKGTPIRTDSGR